MPCGNCGSKSSGSSKKIVSGRGTTQPQKKIQRPSAPRMPKSSLTRRGANYK